MEESNKKRISLPLISLTVLVIAAAIVGGIFYLRGKEEKKENTSTEPKIQVSFFEGKGEEVGEKQEISSNHNLIYSQRTVTGFTDQGQSQYQNNFYLTDLKGEKKYKFYSADDLTYEIAYPYIQDNVLILTEFGIKENRVVSTNKTEGSDIFIPPVGFGSDFIFSHDEKYVAYVENESEASTSGEFSFDLKYKIKVKNLVDGQVIEFDPNKIKHNEILFSQYLPVGISPEDKKLYIFASQPGYENIYQTPSGLYALDFETKESNEIYFSSIDEREDIDLIMLLGVFPEHGYALANRGPQINKDNKTIFRTQLQKIDLKTKKFSDLFLDESIDMVGAGGKILSSDGKKIALLNDAYNDKGLSLYDIEKSSKIKLLDKGEFIAWAPDNITIIYRLYSADQSEEGNISERVELHTMNVETNEDYLIYVQTSLSEGTGLNKEGDVFYSFIGTL